MPLDALCLTALAGELTSALHGAKVDKIYQPSRDDVVLSLRTPDGAIRLLLSANPSHPRLHLTGISRENPDKPPMFCMLLRKHLIGARILDVIQPPLERAIRLTMEAHDELGDRVPRHLVLEAMGRHSNLILLDEEERIVDCLHRVDSNMSVQRQVLPGLFYRQPPVQKKENPFSQDQTSFEALLRAAPAEVQMDQWLLGTFAGLSPLICRELAFRAGGSTDVRLIELNETKRAALFTELQAVLRQVLSQETIPTLLEKDGKPYDFTFLPITQYGTLISCRTNSSYSALLDDFYAGKESQERIRQKGQDLIRAVTNARDRTERKLALQEQELHNTKNRERLRQLGDIITANFHRMEPGMARFRAADFYDEGQTEIEIKLNPLLSPQKNAAKYYKEYHKAKTAEEMLSQQLTTGRKELDYLNSVLDGISHSEGERDLNEIRQELIQTGYLRRPGKAKNKGKTSGSAPMEFRSSSGLRISVGKNNIQNDLLTTKTAQKNDLWLHTQKIHGSHVILWTEGATPDPQSITEAALLAAWFSQGRDRDKVPVDYTQVRFVKKPAGARPGMVIYTTYETAYVTPVESLVNQLRVK